MGILVTRSEVKKKDPILISSNNELRRQIVENNQK